MTEWVKISLLNSGGINILLTTQPHPNVLPSHSGQSSNLAIMSATKIFLFFFFALHEGWKGLSKGDSVASASRGSCNIFHPLQISLTDTLLCTFIRFSWKQVCKSRKT